MQVALTVAGAASLGPFEGGAVAALVTGLQPLCADEHTDVRVRVITGASSGAITGLLAAHSLARGTDAAAILHEAWVERASLGALRGYRLRAPLSLERLRQAAADLLDGADRGDVGRRQHGSVRVELALASLRGWTTDPDDDRADRLAGSHHLDWSHVDVEADMDGRALSRAVELALASAANVAAFPPRLVQPGPLYTHLHGNGHGPGGAPTGYYTDGGLLSTDPVSHAWDVAAAAVADGGGDAGDWLTLLVHPYPTEPPLGPEWCDPEIPPTWVATLWRSLEIRRSDLLARDLRAARARRQAVEVVSPDLLGTGGGAPGTPGDGVLGNFGGFLSRDRRQRDFDLGYRCGRAWLNHRLADLLAARPPGAGDPALVSRSTAVACSAADSAYEVSRSSPPTRPVDRVRETLGLVHVGGRLAAVAVHDAVLADRRAQSPKSGPVAPPAPAVTRRSRRWIHYDGGPLFEARFVRESVVPSVQLAFPADELAAFVRFSPFIDRWPGSEIIGLAVKLVDAHGREQDLLLGSSGPGRLARRVFLLRARPAGATFFSSVLPFAVAGEHLLWGARFDDPAAVAGFDGTGLTGATIRLEVARPWGGWFSLGRLVLQRPLPGHDRRFQPADRWPRISAGALAGLRERVYQASFDGHQAPWWLRVLHIGRR